jgi:probable F420-dependent oxidoreductase
LAFVAARTRTIRLCTGVLVLAQRNPLVVAKQAATLDVLSGGRLTLGVGVGWLAEEFGALGERFSDRGERLDEYLAVMRAMWGEQPARFAGRFFDVPEVHCVPRPMQSDGVPLVVGGDSVHAARRAGRSGDGWFPGFPSPEALAPLVDTMMAAAEANGRDGRTIALSTSYTTDEAALERLRTLGFDHFTVAVPAHKIVGPGALDAALEALAKRIGLR